MSILRSRIVFVFALAFGCCAHRVDAAACVWKVTAPNGGVLYLGGSVHALSRGDYPLPAAYNRAFDASNRLAFEVDHKALTEASRGIDKAGEYPRGDSLKNHVDPRTYAYLKKLFTLVNVSEDKFTRYRPWYLALMLQAPALHGLSSDLGVEEFLMRRAQTTRKPASGLETMREHMDVFAGLTDRQSEAMLLLMFIPVEGNTSSHVDLMKAWRRGDPETATRMVLDGFRDYPSLGNRILTARNHNWIPKIENYIRSGQTYFVVAGAAHFGGPEGVLALLRQRGYKIEQM
jgi:uncharacterized protein YbaP (TraB family)